MRLRIPEYLTRVVPLLVVSLTVLQTAHAQPKPGYLPSSTHIFPAGGQRGTTVAVRVGTECVPPRTHFQMSGEGVDAAALLETELETRGEPSARRKPTIIPITYPREWASEIRIADDAPPGPAYWRLNCAQGGTGSRPFVVGDLPEFVESESNSTLERAERVSLPVTLNGQIHGERDVDYYRMTLPERQSVSFEIVAGRIGSRLDPVVEVLDAEGRPVNVERVHMGSDPILVVWSKQTRDVVFRIANVNHRGDPSFVYRVNVRKGPCMLSAIPGGTFDNEPVEIDLAGPNGRGTAYRTMGKRAFGNPTGPPPKFPDPEDNFSLLRISNDEHPVVVENEPNTGLAEAEQLTLPVTAYGSFYSSFDGPSDSDSYAFEGRKDDRFRIECRAWPPGGQAMPTVKVLVDGKSLASTNSASSDDGIARIAWTAPADGTYELQLADMRFGRVHASDSVYRLVIEPDDPDFELSIATDSLTATQGQTAKLDISVRRHGGLKDEIELSFEGLPDGVEVSRAAIPQNKSSTKVEFTVAESTRVASHQLRVTGKVAGTDLTRTARCRHLGVDSEGVSIGSSTVPWLFLSVQHKPMFRLECAEAYLYGYRGSVFRYAMQIERLNGFDGVIRLQRGDRQNRDMDGVEILDATLSPGESEIEVPIYLPESMHINVQSQTQLYSQAWATFTDEYGEEQSILVLSEKRNMLRTLPPVVKLNATKTELTVPGSGNVECRIVLDRTSNFPGPMDVVLRNGPPEVTVEPVRIQQDASAGVVSMRCAPSMTFPADVTLRGTGQLDDGTVVISETTVRLVR